MTSRRSLGRAADTLVGALDDPTMSVLSAAIVRQRLADAAPTKISFPRVLATRCGPSGSAAALSDHAAASGAGELHHRDLSQVAALRLAFAGFAGQQQLGPEEIRQRVRSPVPCRAASAATAHSRCPCPRC